MSEIERIREQLELSLSGDDPWHGASVRQALAGIDSWAASGRPIPAAHTVWEILRHLIATVELVRDRVRGEPRAWIEEENWPVPPAAGDEEAWQHDLERLREAHLELLATLAGVDDQALDAPVVADLSTLYVTLHGLAQHHLFHAGQIVLLKKAVAPPGG